MSKTQERIAGKTSYEISGLVRAANAQRMRAITDACNMDSHAFKLNVDDDSHPYHRAIRWISLELTLKSVLHSRILKGDKYE